MERKCSDLKVDEQVVFLKYSDVFKRKTPMDGTVLSVSKEQRKVLIDWLEGYKDRHDVIPFEDMLAVYNPDGEMMKFEYISGKSDRLIPE